MAEPQLSSLLLRLSNDRSLQKALFFRWTAAFEIGSVDAKVVVVVNVVVVVVDGQLRRLDFQRFK